MKVVMVGNPGKAYSFLVCNFELSRHSRTFDQLLQVLKVKSAMLIVETTFIECSKLKFSFL